MPENDNGCQWVVGKVKKWNSARKGYEMQPVHCRKLVATGSLFCPRHKLIAAEQKQEQKVERYY
jgi:hypothetical protein